jgi:cytochrome c biogenesis protein CcdA
MAETLTLGLVITAALADSINPCVFGVLIFLLAAMTKIFKSKTRMLIGGLIYTAVVYVTYLFIGLGILKLANNFLISTYFYWFAAILALVAGLLEIKDYFWYGKGFSLQIIPGAAERIKKITKLMARMNKKHPALGYLIAGFLGIFVVFVELPCTGAPYLVVLGLLSAGEFAKGVPLLLLYNFIFVLPLFVIIGMMYLGQTSKALEKWRKDKRGLMRLGVGIFLILLGVYMIWSITGQL